MSPDDHRPAVPDLAVQDLYETDFYLWTQAQAEAIRAEANRGGAIDWDRVAEEIQDMGGRDLRECYSRTATIIEHLLKLAWTKRKAPKSGWRQTIRTQRRDLRRALTPTIRRHVEAKLEELHDDAAKDASSAFTDEEPAAPRDTSLRWTLAQILGDENDPIA